MSEEWCDTEYEETTITEVRGDAEKGWEIKRSDGFSFMFECKDFTPLVGMTARFYGKGIGYIVRGLVIDGHEIFYRTREQDDERHRNWCEERERAQREEFNANKDDLDRRFSSLPHVFQQRIQRFRDNNPDFRWQYESYELFCCEQAVEIANHVPLDGIDEFCRLPWESQKAAVPGLDDGHSGNTFGCAALLAKLYLSQPENVVKLHGALSPLVGSKAYGCVPREEAGGEL